MPSPFVSVSLKTRYTPGVNSPGECKYEYLSRKNARNTSGKLREAREVWPSLNNTTSGNPSWGDHQSSLILVICGGIIKVIESNKIK